MEAPKRLVDGRLRCEREHEANDGPDPSGGGLERDDGAGGQQKAEPGTESFAKGRRITPFGPLGRMVCSSHARIEPRMAAKKSEEERRHGTGNAVSAKGHRPSEHPRSERR